jgi:hypothetical protein
MSNKKKKMLKPLLCLVLVLFFSISFLIIPGNASGTKFNAGQIGVGPLGWTCYCDFVFYATCFCALLK